MAMARCSGGAIYFFISHELLSSHLFALDGVEALVMVSAGLRAGLSFRGRWWDGGVAAPRLVRRPPLKTGAAS